MAKNYSNTNNSNKMSRAGTRMQTKTAAIPILLRVKTAEETQWTLMMSQTATNRGAAITDDSSRFDSRRTEK